MQLQDPISRDPTLGSKSVSYLIAALAIKENPANLNHFGRVLGHIHAVLVAGRGHVDNDVSVQLWNCRSGGRHLGAMRTVGFEATEGGLAVIVEEMLHSAAAMVSRML